MLLLYHYQRKKVDVEVDVAAVVLVGAKHVSGTTPRRSAVLNYTSKCHSSDTAAGAFRYHICIPTRNAAGNSGNNLQTKTVPENATLELSFLHTFKYIAPARLIKIARKITKRTRG